jgi:hypothetical protein
MSDEFTAVPASMTSAETASPASMSSSAEILARRTAAPDESTSERWRRLSAMSSSALLMRVARDLFSARIQPESAQMRLGLGGDSDPRWNDLITWCCPSESEPVALALTASGTACFCSLRGPTPCARDWKDGKNAEHGKKHFLRNQAEGRGSQFPRWVAWKFGFMPGPLVYEKALGFPEGWTDIGSEASATVLRRRSQSSSAGASSKRKRQQSSGDGA